MNKFNEPYHFDPETNRVALPISEYLKLDADVNAYLYSLAYQDSGLDPWFLIDSVDQHIDKQSVDLWFYNGGFKRFEKPFSEDLVLYVVKKDVPEEFLKVEAPTTQEETVVAKLSTYALIKINQMIHQSGINCIDALYFTGADNFDIDKHLAAVKAKFLELKQ